MFDLPFSRKDLEPRDIIGYSVCCHNDRLAICNHMDTDALPGYTMQVLLSYEDRHVRTPGWKLILALGVKFQDPECHLALYRDLQNHDEAYRAALES